MAVGLAGHLTFAAFAQHLAVLRADGTTVATLDAEAGSLTIQRMLAFDGRVAYVATKAGVSVFRAADLSEMAWYATVDAVSSMAEVGDCSVFSMHGAISVASSACPAMDDAD